MITDTIDADYAFHIGLREQVGSPFLAYTSIRAIVEQVEFLSRRVAELEAREKEVQTLLVGLREDVDGAENGLATLDEKRAEMERRLRFRVQGW